MNAPKSELSDRWIQHQRKSTKTTPSWACIYCVNRRIFAAEQDLWEHAKTAHDEKLEAWTGDMDAFRVEYAAESAQKRPTKDNSQPRAPNLNDYYRAQPEPPPLQGKRGHEPNGPPPTTRSISDIRALDINTSRGSEDVPMRDVSDDGQAAEDNRPSKRPAIGDGISAGSRSPYRDSSPSLSPHRPGRPSTGGRRLWQEGQAGPTKSSFNDPSNIASTAAQKARAAQQPQTNRRSFQPQPQPPSFQSSRLQIPHNIPPPPPPPPTIQTSQIPENFDIVLQPETRPISQEQLVAEVKGIYAGLVMVEAKCIEVDNKQATLAQADPGAQPNLNNEQWQALIALHRTLLHEHHDFFLASQHPSASPALRRLASKYAMPARMWRHGIHSFLELLRHRLPASLDHMLAFIYLAYSMMALLYETVPAFEDTWIECLGDLGRYRMAIEDDDIRDKEVWTGVARHWYSKASDKAPTTGRLYHHLAILARPNALQHLFYYAKSLLVAIPFTSARESILTLFDPALHAENQQAKYRLPPLDTSFVKAHGLLFTNKRPERFEPTVKEFLSLLDNQIGRVTRKFMEQGYHIAVANCVAMLGFASKDNTLMKAISSSDVECSPADGTPRFLSSFPKAQRRSNDTLKIVFQRLEGPNFVRKCCYDKIQSQDSAHQYSGRGSNNSAEDASPRSNSERRSSVFYRLRRYAGAIAFSTFCLQFGTAAASGPASVENKSRHFLQPMLEPEAVGLAFTLGAGIGGARIVQRYWDIDMMLFLNFLFNLGIGILAEDPRFSDGELLVLCIYSAATNFHWMKQKLLKLPKTGGVTAFGIGALGIHSGWKFAHQLPGLQARYENKCMAKVTASLPFAASYSLVWWAFFEQTGLAQTIESRIDNPESWNFIIRILKSFLIHFSARAIQVFVENLFGRVDTGFQNNLFQGLAHDVEADPRAPWNEPFHGHVNENDVFPRRPDGDNPRAYYPGNQPFQAPDSRNFDGQERYNGPDNENSNRQRNGDDPQNDGIYRQESEYGISARGESPLRLD